MIFAQSYLPRAVEAVTYIPVTALLIAVAAARLASRSRRAAAVRA